MMRDEMNASIGWDRAGGVYRLGKNPDAGQPAPGGSDLALLYRAIAFEEEYLYVTFRTASGSQKRLHALPGKIRKLRGRRQPSLREPSGAICVVDLASISEVAEAFGVNK